jgi:hypothetical protein
MPNCPRCNQFIDIQSLSCPYCRIPLKAYGHSGIPLHRAIGEASLCESCTYNADDTCNFPQRPHARECTLYQDISQIKLGAKQNRNTNSNFFSTASTWVRRNQTWLLLLGLLFISFLIAL